MDTPSMRVTHLLNDATNDIRKSADRALEDAGVSDIDWAILNAVCEASERDEASCTITEIARRIGRDAEVVRREAFRLEGRKLLRIRQQDDLLSSVVTLSSRGERLLPALTAALEAMADQAMSGLTNDELDSLGAMLQRISTNLS